MGEPQNLDVQKVSAFLAEALRGFQGPLTAEKFSDGQSNPTYLLTAPSGRYVLRRKPPGQLLKSAHAVDREYRVQKALEGTNVPVAKMHVLCEEDAVIGSAFYVMDHVPGAIYFDPRLPDLPLAARAQVYDAMRDGLAAIHTVDLAAVGLSEYGPPGNYIARQVSRWAKQYRASATEEIADMDHLIAALEERVASGFGEGAPCLVHGDYRIDNLIFDAQHRLAAVLDWELSTLGHPMADLASVIMQWQMPPGAEGRGLAGVDRAAEGLPSDAAFIEGYCAARGVSVPEEFGDYLAFSFFRMGAVLQGVKKRALDGNASNPNKALRIGAYVPAFAAKGREALTRG